MEPGNRFSNDNALAIQIRWTNRLAVIQSLVIRSQQIVVHATATQMACHVKNCVAITNFYSDHIFF